jgi:hypothetical protein
MRKDPALAANRRRWHHRSRGAPQRPRRDSGGRHSHGASHTPGQLAARPTGRWGLAGLDGRRTEGTINCDTAPMTL